MYSTSPLRASSGSTYPKATPCAGCRTEKSMNTGVSGSRVSAPNLTLHPRKCCSSAVFARSRGAAGRESSTQRARSSPARCAHRRERLAVEDVVGRGLHAHGPQLGGGLGGEGVVVLRAHHGVTQRRRGRGGAHHRRHRPAARHPTRGARRHRAGRACRRPRSTTSGRGRPSGRGRSRRSSAPPWFCRRRSRCPPPTGGPGGSGRRRPRRPPPRLPCRPAPAQRALPRRGRRPGGAV